MGYNLKRSFTRLLTSSTTLGPRVAVQGIHTPLIYDKGFIRVLTYTTAGTFACRSNSTYNTKEIHDYRRSLCYGTWDELEQCPTESAIPRVSPGPDQ